MTIEKLILKNYASINTAMNCRHLEIDFSKRKNKICLLIAPNGGGKTSILSALTPFASLGNLDVRDGQPLILKHEKGYKEIHYRKGRDYYIIKHFYTPTKETHSVKSYIEKNGVELNPNGNVRSFHELVKIELDLEIDYLKLIRLGNNVTNLIGLKTTERKNFMSKLLETTDVYLSLYKKVSVYTNQIRLLMNHLLDKIRKTGIQDIDDALDLKKQLEETIQNKKQALHGLQDQFAIVCSKLSELPSHDELVSEVSKTAKQLEKLTKSFENHDTVQSVREMRKKVEKQLHNEELLQENASTALESKLSSLDDYHKEKDQLIIDIEKAIKDSNIISLENIVSDLEHKIRNQESKFKDVKYEYTKEELEFCMKFLDEQEDLLSTIYSFGDTAIHRVLDLKAEQIPVDTYIQVSIKELENSEFENACRIVFERMRKDFSDLPPCIHGTTTCKYIDFYDRLTEMQYHHSEKGKTESMTLLEYMDIVNNRLRQFFDRFPEHKDIFDHIPKEVMKHFDANMILEKIRKKEPIYPKKLFNQMLSEVTEYENYKQLIEDLHQKTKELRTERKKSYLGYMTDRLETVNSMIASLESEVATYRNHVDEQMTSISNSQQKLDYLEDLEEILSKKEEIQERHDNALTQYKQVLDLNEQHSSLQFQIRVLEEDLQAKEKDSQYLEFQIAEYQKLHSELSKYSSIFDEANIVKTAWSTKEGIPLKHIQMYLDGIRESANELMDIVYQGTSYIDEFKIDDSEFRIPFVTKGILVDDVVYSSQGEESFLSIALSFALIAKNMTSYNIMLLDEVDSTLDTKNRAAFISVIERQIERTGVEQCFVITHNNMFDMYPVDVLLLSGDKDKNNKLLNYLDIKKVS